MPDPDPLSLACERVGRWLWHFSQIERCLGEGIVRLYRLQGVAGDILVVNLDFSRKVNIVETMAVKHEGEPTKEIATLFGLIRSINDDRQIVVHSAFEPVAGGVVRFRRATAKGTVRMNLPEWTWDKKRFEVSYSRMSEINDALQTLIDRLAN